MKYLLFFIILFGSFHFCSCTNATSKVTDTISKMQSKPVYIPFNQMSCWINDTVQNDRPWEQADLKLVVYTDSFDCSQCTLKKMYLWKDFVELEKKYDDIFFIFFIIQSGSNSTHALSSNFHFTGLNHPIYIDSTNVFMRDNPHIPEEVLFHVFLLDEKDSVVLVGNPLFSTKIEDLLIKQVDDRMKKLLTKER